MKYWFDTEFIDTGKIIHPISIGIISEDNRTFYAEWDDCDHSLACPWVKENVLTKLEGKYLRKNQIRQEIVKFTNYGIPEFWAYYGAYDWVVLCQLFGRMLDVPPAWPHLYLDVRQAAGNIQLPKQITPLHHALNDAIWTKQAYEFLAK